MVGKPQGKKAPVRSRPKWKDNMKTCYKKQDGRAWTVFMWLKIETSSVFFERGNEVQGI